MLNTIHGRQNTVFKLMKHMEKIKKDIANINNRNPMDTTL